jgi:hypothetical protein
MTDANETPAPDPVADIQEQFWALRAATDEKIADRLQAVLDAIEEGRSSGLYRDGLPTRLNDVALATTHHLNRLRPPPAAPAPI